jgi:hypothetical protein
MDYAEYEKIDKAYRWMCYPTMPVVEFFKLWRARWEKLVWIPVQNPRRGPASALWWYRAIPGSDEEQYILSSDTEYEPTNDVDDEDSNSDSDAESNDDFSGGGDVENSEDMILSDNELDDILEDAFGKEAQKKRQEFTSDFARSTDDSLSAPSSEPDTHVTTKSDPEEQEADVNLLFLNSPRISDANLPTSF